MRQDLSEDLEVVAEQMGDHPKSVERSVGTVHEARGISDLPLAVDVDRGLGEALGTQVELVVVATFFSSSGVGCCGANGRTEPSPGSGARSLCVGAPGPGFWDTSETPRVPGPEPINPR